MKKIMVLTSMRTGSTWLTFLVKNLVQMRTSFARSYQQVNAGWFHNAVVKAHKYTPEEIFKFFPDAYVITSVRNPKGRTTSQFYFMKPFDEERFNKILTRSYKYAEKRQLNRMWEGFSTRSFDGSEMSPHYLWTTYEWMKEDIHREARAICTFLGLSKSDRYIKDAVDRTERDCKNIGIIRKGVVDSWKDEYFKERLEILDKHQEMYYNRVNGELGEEE